jgi:pimeloyl-ACP methyl ester carboxylesterase
MGGFIALTMAAAHGSKVGHLVIIGSRASGPDLEVGSVDLDPSHYEMLDDLKLQLIGNNFPNGLDDPGRADFQYHQCTAL